MASTTDITPTSTPGASTSTSHLSYPTPVAKEESPSPESLAPPREQVKNRLYVGNLHPTVDELTFVKIFQKYGKLKGYNYLFHKTGPSKGKPRGYAFIEFEDKDAALKALVGAHDKLVRGRKLVVTYASQAANADISSSSSSRYHRRGEPQRPTALSLLKQSSQHGRLNDKIAAMEAKLNQMQKDQEPAQPATPEVPIHPSLPLKPPPEQPNAPSLNQSVISAVTSAATQAGISKNSTPKPHSSLGAATAKGPGKKPTLNELLKSRKAGAPTGLLKR